MNYNDLQKIQKESTEQTLPRQKKVLSVADKDYILSRDKVKDKKRGEIFKAILKASHTFEKSGEFLVACRVQDNLAGETIYSKKIKV